MQTITIPIDGMSCGHCVAAVSKALSGVKGVTVQKVEIGSATVAFDPAVVSRDRIEDAIADAGYATRAG